MEAMTEINAKILKYVNDRGSASIEEIKAQFPDISAIEYRLKKLSTPEYHHFHDVPVSIPKGNSSLLRERATTSEPNNFGERRIQALGIYELTEYGKRELQDYLLQQRTAKKELWLKNAWIPIIVSLATTVIVNYILPKLPQILLWFSNILSETFS